MKSFFSVALVLFFSNGFAQKAIKLQIDGLIVNIPATNPSESSKSDSDKNCVSAMAVSVNLGAEKGNYSFLIYPLEVVEQNDSTEMAKILMVDNNTFDENALTSTLTLKKQLYLSKTSTWTNSSKEQVVVKQLKTFLKDQLYIIYIWGNPSDMAKELNIQQILGWTKFSKFTKI